MNRLVKAHYNEREESFTYDLAGNRLSQTINSETSAFIYNTKNQLTELHKDLGITNFTYDAQGNILKESMPKGTTSFEYNALNQQTKVTTYQGQTLANRYDAEGLRAEIEENEKLTRFIFHRNEILVEADENDIPISRFARGYDVVAGDIADDEQQQTKRYYYQLDEQFSTSFITNASGKVENRYTYDAFGNTLESQENVHNRIKYTGQQYDPVTEQYYLRARFYNPILGRFMQEDIYRGDGLNLYAYCENNPVMYYDPSGYAHENKEDNVKGNTTEGNTNKTAKGVSKTKSFMDDMSPAEAARYKDYWHNVYSENYGNVVNSNKPWTWRDMPGGDKLTATDKVTIKSRAVERALIPDVKMKQGTRYADFEGAGVVQRVEPLPEHLWKASDSQQFNYLDELIGGRPQGTTWNHSQISGRMELVPFGIHNVTNHMGGRSPGHWAHAKR